jgi:hypothetical protein
LGGTREHALAFCPFGSYVAVVASAQLMITGFAPFDRSVTSIVTVSSSANIPKSHLAFCFFAVHVPLFVVAVIGLYPLGTMSVIVTSVA